VIAELNRLIDAVEAHPAEDLDGAGLARELGMSPIGRCSVSLPMRRACRTSTGE